MLKFVLFCVQVTVRKETEKASAMRNIVSAVFRFNYVALLEGLRFKYLSHSVNYCTNVKPCTRKPFYMLQFMLSLSLENVPMEEQETKRKKQKKLQLVVMEEQQEETQNAVEVAQALEELEKEGKRVDIQVCPKCKSPRIRKAKSTGGDMWAHMGLLPPSYECPDCGWQERLVLKATNRPMSVREVELIAEAKDIEDKASK